MTVWLVYHSDCHYEGGTVEAVFSTRDKAEAYALVRVEQEQEHAMISHRVASKSFPDLKYDEPDPWTREAELTWGDGMKVINVYSVEVDSDEPALLHAYQLKRSREFAAREREET